jgi:CelD/BcsL family acetyltransferase involved in cellulose biosynthesis
VTGELALEHHQDLTPLRAEWPRVAEASGNVFATLEWVDAWTRNLGAGRPLHVLACRREGGELAALWPLYLAAERPVRTLRLLGHGPADRLGAVCAPADRPAAARALRRALAGGLAGWQALFLSELPGEEGWPPLVGGRPWGRQPSPVLRIEGDWAQYLASRSANLRSEIRSRERRLRREHGMTLRLAQDPGDLEILIALHQARWGARSSAFAGSWGALHREFAAAALRRGWLRLWLMELDGRPAAAHYGLRFGGTDSYYQSGRDPARDRLGVGSALLVHAIRDAVESGMREFRFLRGDEAYKLRYASEDPGVEAVAMGRGARGRATLAAAAAARRLLPYERRRRLARLAG